MANTAPDSWTETCLITLYNGTTAMNIAALLEPSDLIELGDREVEYKPNLAGGRTRKILPEEDTILTFEGEFVGIGDTDDTDPDGLIAHYYEGTDTNAPFTVDNYAQALRVRSKWQAFFLWTDDSTVSAATGAIVSGANALRARCIQATFVSCKPSMSENEMRFIFKFRVPARTKLGGRTITWESTDGMAAMASLGTIT